MPADGDHELSPSALLTRCGEIEGFEAFVIALGFPSLDDWIASWLARDGLSLAQEVWPVGVDPHWIASVGLPLLDQVQQQQRSGGRSLLGLAAMPGCGKSTLCAWIKAAAAASMDLAVEVVSIDDFYFEGSRLDEVMRGNPWQAPRGIPGSHDLVLLAQCLSQWRQHGVFQCPVFDKSLRQGRGDRAGFREVQADLLILEGWFVGVGHWGDHRHDQHSQDLAPLTPAELSYRAVVRDNLIAYQQAWDALDLLWHLCPTSLAHVTTWKQQQNAAMYQGTGVKMSDADLGQMTRSLQVCIPEFALLHERPADVVLRVNTQRQVEEVLLAGD